MAEFLLAKIYLIDEHNNGYEQIVVVPDNFLSCDTQQQMCVQYMQPPYNDEDFSLIEDIVTNKAPAPASWPHFKCLEATAYKSYEDANAALQSMQVQGAANDGFINSKEFNKNDNIKQLLNVPSINMVKSNMNIQKSHVNNEESIVDDVKKSTDQKDPNVNTGIISDDLTAFKDLLFQHISNCMEDFKNKIYKKISNLDKTVIETSSKIVNMQTDIDEIKTFVTDNRALGENQHIITLSKFAEATECVFPLQTLNEFQSFDDKIKDEFGQQLKLHFLSTINTNNSLLKICTTILKTFFTKGILKNFTAQKKSTIKNYVFKDTYFYKYFKEALMHAFANKQIIEDSVLLSIIGHVFNNSADWGGYRAKRSKSNNDEETESKEN